MNEASRRSDLIWAVSNGQAERVRSLLRSGADHSLREETGSTALCLAAERGEVECVAELLRGGADANLTSAKGYAPLMFAAFGGREEHCKIVLLLLEHGANPNYKRESGETALSIAARRNERSEGIIEAWIEREALTEIDAPVQRPKRIPRKL